jgi:3-hydroxyisobutyrate dehydrogenase-like beta-hydroxyacid dehydrogenase
MKVGFIGLGVMGGPMAANVLKGGHELTVYDLNPAAVAQLTALGAKAAASPRELGQASEVVITMLPEPQHVEGAILGEHGAAAGMPAGSTVIDMSTIDPATSQRIGAALKARGIAMVDSPVGKTSEHAVTGTLTLMIGGDAADIERVRPVLSCMGNQFFLCGGQGMGHAMKMTNNLLATTIMCANTEALAIGAKCGLTLETIVTALHAHYGGELGGDAIVDARIGAFSPAGKLPLTVYYNNVTARDIRDVDLASAGGITHAWFEGPVLLPFGWGLSFTSFSFRASFANAARGSGPSAVSVAAAGVGSGTCGGSGNVSGGGG